MRIAVVAGIMGCADQPTTVTGPSPVAPQLAIPPGPYTPGTAYFGRNQYIEYIAGNLPVIFSAPHGGSLEPTEITTRTDAACGGDAVTATDVNTQELTRAIRTAFFNRTGKYPHIIINRLHRKKLDANRSLSEGACGDNEANIAWDEFHDFIDVAKSRVLADYGRGWYTDIHGHGHSIARLELGYMLEGVDLRLSDATLNGSTTYENESSFRTFSQQSPLAFATLLRGNVSLGTLFASASYPATPSGPDPAPDDGESYFSGGYNTDVHGCDGGGNICGFQIEHHYTGVRDNSTNRANFSAALARIYAVFLAQNFGISLVSTRGEIIADNNNANNDTNRATFSASTNWSTGTAQAEKHLNDYKLADGNGPTNDGAAFSFYVSSPGNHSVYAWWTDASDRTASASYRVFELDGGTMFADLTRDQRTGGGQWNLLGTWNFTKVGWAKVLMSRSLSGAGKISADAIRAVRL